MSKLEKKETVEMFKTNDDLRCYIHDIHNYLRNKGVGYGLTALNIFSVFYGLKLIETHLDSLNLSKEEKKILNFRELVKIANDYENEITGYIDKTVLETLFNMSKDESNNNKELAKFLFHEIPKDVKDSVWKELVLKIDKIPVGYTKNDKVNLSGKIYEYFIGRDKTAISELGAYFTDRHIVEFIFDKIKPTLDEGNNIKTMIDPFGGSGGFTLGYANYLNHNFSGKFNWKNNVDKIFHFDIQKDVINMTGIEMFAITGHIPDRDSNYLRKNSFTNEFQESKNSERYKYDLVISNPPYGGDKLSKTADYDKKKLIINKLKEQLKELENSNENSKNTKVMIDNKREQLNNIIKDIKKYEENQRNQFVKLINCSQRIKNFAKKYEIDNANDKEACSLILLADLLAENGTAVLVLKEGVFFDNKYTKLREVITNNYNVTDIISVPQDAFENTSTKTSIIIFKNNGKTKKINFSEIIVETEPENVFNEDENGIVSLEKYKGEIYETIERNLSSATFEQISEPTITTSKGKNSKEIKKYHYSWNYKTYKDYTHFVFGDYKYDIKKPDNYKLVKFGDVFEFKPKTKRPASFGKDVGKYRFYTSSNKIKYCDICDINDKDSTYLIFGTGGNGSLFIDNQFSCSADNLVCSVNNNLIGIYSYYYVKIFWDEFVDYHFNGSTMGHIKKENLIKTQIPIPKDIIIIKPQLESLKSLHEKITNNTELIPEKEKHICELIKKLTDEGEEGVDYDSRKLGNICEIKYGTRITKNNNLGTEYPVYGGVILHFILIHLIE